MNKLCKTGKSLPIRDSRALIAETCMRRDIRHDPRVERFQNGGTASHRHICITLFCGAQPCFLFQNFCAVFAHKLSIVHQVSNRRVQTTLYPVFCYSNVLN